MRDQDKTKEQLIAELEALRRRVSAPDQSRIWLKSKEFPVESERITTLLNRYIPIAYQALDENGYLLEVNEAWLNSLGYAREEVIGKWFGDFLPPDDQGHFEINFPKLKADGEIHGIETDIVAKNRSHIAVVFDGLIERDERGRVEQAHCVFRNTSEIRQAQRALRESEGRYRAVVDNIEIGITVLNSNLEIVEVNKALRNLFPHGTRGQTCYEHYHDPPRSEICSYCPAVRTFQDGEVHQVVAEVQVGSEVKYFHLVSSPIKDSEGRVRYVIALTQDITERIRTERTIQRASAYYRSLIEASLDPFVTISIHGKITDVNSATERVSGYSREELIGSDFTNYFSNPQKAKAGYERAFAEGSVEDYELEIQHRDGHVTPVVYNASVYLDSSGGIAGLFAAARDISRRRQLEEKNLWLAAIVEYSNDGIVGKTLEGIITSWNRGAERIYGYKDTEAVGRPISFLSTPDRQHEVSSILERIGRGEHIERYETVRRKKDGRDIDVSLTISPIRNPEGRVVGASTIIRDITEQKDLQRQLLQAQKMEAIGTLSGGIAHDFNNILTVIQGFSELLLMSTDEQDPNYEDLRKVNDASKKGADLVQRILSFSRKTDINLRPLNLNQEIEQVKKLLGRTLPKMIKIEVFLSNDIAMVHADAGQVEQVLMNLAVNAKDAMPDGGKLTIETKNVVLDEETCRMDFGAEPGNYVLLSVTDTGHGMTKETLDHMFEPFYTTKDVGKGTGLGLAMVYGIVKQHGGCIGYCSEPGLGTTFRIYFPAIETGIDQKVSQGGPMPVSGVETILLVDDEEFIRDLGRRILERSGYTVLTAANGEEALDLYQRGKNGISLVILDLIMPEMGGKQCLEELLRIDPRARVLIATGFSTEGWAKEVTETGAKGFIGKPYNVRMMLHTVRQVLDSD